MRRKTKESKIMEATLKRIPSAKAEPFWLELKGLSDSLKLELITLLSSSIKFPEKESEPRTGWADRFCGVWKDSRTADEIVNDIYSMRTANHLEEIS